jgi:hypothetical protein
VNINFKTIPHDKHRYETCGDYWYDTGTDTLELRVSEMKDPRMEVLVAVHEIVEAELCRQDGVDYSAIDRFDKRFEANRKRGNEDEPGDDTRAPYYSQHHKATAIERTLCEFFGIKWADYEKAILELFE